MLNITDATYVARVYFSWSDNGRNDILGMLYREGDGPWQITFRFRYGVDDSIWQSQDRKSWTQLTAMDGTEASRQKLNDAFLTTMASATRIVGDFGRMDIVDVNGAGPSAFYEACKDRRWFHAKAEAR